MDDTEAIKWFRMAAEQGDTEAQLNLGEAYHYGNSVEQDYAEAVKWYRMAAEQGNTEALFNLGNAYYNSNGIEQDYAEAVKWYCMSVEQEHSFVQYDWGERFEFGKDVPQDLDAAKHLFSLAARLGYRKAMEVIDIVFERKDIEAMFERGNAYMFGDESQNIFWSDYAMAEIWYRRAAVRGHKEAAVQLSKLLKTE